MSVRLKAILEMAQADAKARSVEKREHHVFSDAIGGKVKSIKKAWETAVLKAYGRKPEWIQGRLARSNEHVYRWQTKPR